MPALLLRPVSRLLSSLCVIKPGRHPPTGMNSLPLISFRENVIVFPKHTPSHARSFSRRCKRCGCDHFVVRQENRVCIHCGESHYYEAEERPSTKAVVRDFNTNANKRITHFKNWVARLQGKERCDISNHVLEMIEKQLKLYPDSVSEYDRIKWAMKDLDKQKYYNHVYYVMRCIFGYSLVEFSKIHEARLLALFMRIQEPFARSRLQRTNMLSYQFLIKKFCELLGYKVAKYIPVLKSRANLQRQDQEWKQICEALDLPFYPSV